MGALFLFLTRKILPGFGGNENPERPVFCLYAAENPVLRPLHKAAIAMRKGPYKMIATFGYPDYDNIFELYDLENDAEELNDISKTELAIFAPLKEELLDHLNAANEPYRNS